MFDKFTEKARAAMSLAQDQARSLGQMYVGTEHFLLALLKQDSGIAATALKTLNVNYDDALAAVKEITQKEAEPVSGGHIPFTPRAKRVLEGAYRETITRGQSYISTEHLLLGIIREGNGVAIEVLQRLGISADAVRNAVDDLIKSDPSAQEKGGPMIGEVRLGPSFMRPMGGVPMGQMPGGLGGEQEGSTLQEFGRNLTKLAKDGKLDPVIGRDAEVERVMQVLARRQKITPLSWEIQALAKLLLPKDSPNLSRAAPFQSLCVKRKSGRLMLLLSWQEPSIAASSRSALRALLKRFSTRKTSFFSLTRFTLLLAPVLPRARWMQPRF